MFEGNEKQGKFKRLFISIEEKPLFYTELNSEPNHQTEMFATDIIS